MEIAPFVPTEAGYRERVGLLKEAQPEEPWSLEGEKQADAVAAAAGRPADACFARVGGEAVGFARAQADPDVPAAGRRRLWVVVARRARRQGVGSALLEAVSRAAAAAGATEWHVSTSLAEPDGRAFALAHGFREVEAEYELHLDLESFEDGARAAPRPIESLASRQRRHPDWFERYYRLHTAVEGSVPWALGYAVPNREDFRRRRVEPAEFLPEGTMIAVVGGEWVGLCEMWRCGDDLATAYQELTGVLPGYRGQGLGTALVAAAAAWAKRRGYRRLLTSTSTSNAAMQRTARRLGFIVAGRWSHLLGPVRRGGAPSGQERHR
ncbi:MAG: GNAT family N-acetyltransferase [Actinobacteria bacterium]|nr:GNAT family N-acetyltransferase [Actinomycetota bacterium]